MKFLVIGLGSMGKRRIRNLKALGYNNIAGFDIRDDRLQEAQEKYGIDIYDNINLALDKFKPDAFIISTSPDKHMEYAFLGFNNNIHCFIEASVIDSEKILELYNLSKGKNILIAPSCTMKYFPMPRKVKELIQNNTIGKVLYFNYHTGQYLPDWHPWEDIKEFYVSNPNTGGCREIVPFELTWINDIFGFNVDVINGFRSKLSNMDINIDDLYQFVLNYENNTVANITVEVLSKPKASRELLIIGSQGKIEYNFDNNELKFINVHMKEYEVVNFSKGTIENGYINPEEPYINEIKDFVKSIKLVEKGQKPIFPNDLYRDYQILQTLYKIEDVSIGGLNDLSR